MRIGVLASHPIQYQAPWFRELAKVAETHVYFAHRQTPAQQAAAGYGVAFEWDVDLLEGYAHTFLRNRARTPDTSRFAGCDTPEVGAAIAAHLPDAFIVSGWHLKCFWQATWACRSTGIPVLVRGDSHLRTQRSLLKRAAKEVVYRVGLRQLDGMLCVGARNREYYEHYGIPTQRLLSAPHCIDVDMFAARSKLTPAQRAEVRKQLDVPENAFLLLHVGRLLDSKRPTDIVKAAALTRRAAGAAFHTLFIGAGPAETEVRRVAASLGAAVSFAGFVNQTKLPELYAIADAVVMASSETWGLVVNEAAACGVPAIVSSEVGCGPDMIRAGTTGEVYPMGDIDALAGAMDRVAGYRNGERTRLALMETSDLHSPRHAAACTVEGIERLLHARRTRQA